MASKCAECKGTNLCWMHFIIKQKVFGAREINQVKKQDADVIPQPKIKKEKQK